MTKGWVYNHCTIFTRFKSKQEKTRVVDPKLLPGISDPDPTLQLITDPDPDPTTSSAKGFGSGRIRIRNTAFLTSF